MTAQVRRARWVRLGWAAVDALIWVVMLFAALWIRLDFELDDSYLKGTAYFALAAMAGQILVGYLVGPYSISHVMGSFEEIVELMTTTAIVGAVLFLWALMVEPVVVPRGLPLTAGALAIGLMFALRFVVRTVRSHRAMQTPAERRAVVLGAGEAGRRLLRSMKYDGAGPFVPVALLDDDPSKHRLRLEGLRVRGTRADLAAVAERYEADTLVLALPNAEAATLRDLAARAADAGLDVVSLPPLKDIIGGRPTPNDLRDLDVADLLGRRPVQLDTTAIAEQISGRRVLVTGAGGSIGSELCRQIARFGPSRLYMLDRDESGLQATEMSLSGHGLLDSDDLILADIRDPKALADAFESARPEVVFHAAALKHLPLLESHPLEAWKSNVIGTLNVLTAAEAAGVSTFVNISTDKAANPTCVLGYSKRLAERLTADFARRAEGRYVSVRFGNVLGSRGSVVHAFTAQIEMGGPITVTHPDVRRYFMLIPEACQLVLEAASIGVDGEVMVLEMGEQVKILEVAQTLIRMSGRRNVDIVFTGLRPGEKIAEELFTRHEGRRQTSHPLVDSVDVPHFDSDALRVTHFAGPGLAVEWMREEALSTGSATMPEYVNTGATRE
ncbi:nucleoside-diphosphate sugar epimerase/dehydratase [Terrabacter sp. Root85]|uniref:polysaccharide biosynthesis protein n=1 Tax=Terrabacter sp. Root85 TaxID=1736603 RepID=UPI000A5CF445|nr:nucleoside-diphosphate sugar epimerase/dehydratase [Terrabacter sp. Root85]